MITTWLPWWIGAYLVGSIPFGLLLARTKGVDIRKHGSGNIGATNVWRVLGRRLGIICFTLDVLKGLGPVLAAGIVTGVISTLPTSSAALCWLGVAAAAISGHMFPVWLRFRGGKGVATGLGALLGVYPVMTAAGVGALLVWIISARLTRMVGISSCLAALTMPLGVLAGAALARRNHATDASLIDVAWPYLLVAVLLAAVVIYKHRSNIRRTLDGTEARIGQRAPAPSVSAAPTTPPR